MMDDVGVAAARAILRAYLDDPQAERPDDPAVRPFRALALCELAQLKLPEHAWVVDGLLPDGSATLLTAREKAGKGLLALDLCCAVALGEPFLGRPTRQGLAIYAAAEEHPALIRDRLVTRLGERVVPTPPLGVLMLDGSTEDRLRLEDPDEFARLVGMVQDERPAVLVLDTLRELHDRAEDRSDEMGPLLRPLRQLAHQFGLALVVNHHQNKGQEFRGSTAIRAAFDQEWNFRRSDRADDGPAAGTLTVEGRFGAKQVVRVRLSDGLRWTVAPPEAGSNGGDRLTNRVVAFLAERPDGATAAELALGLGASAGGLHEALAALTRGDAPVLLAAGSGVRGDPRRYRLTPGDGGGGTTEPATRPLWPMGSGIVD